MGKYFPGFNSSERQKKELILDEKYCIKLGNIFAHLGFMSEGESLEIFRGSQSKENDSSFVNTKVGFPVPTFWH